MDRLQQKQTQSCKEKKFQGNPGSLVDKEPTDPCNPPLDPLLEKQSESDKEDGFQGNLGSLKPFSSQNSCSTVGSFVCSAKDNIKKGGSQGTVGSLDEPSSTKTTPISQRGGIPRGKCYENPWFPCGHTLSNRLSSANQTNPTELNTELWSALPHELLARVCLFGDALRYRHGQFVSQIRQTDPRVVLLRPMIDHMQQFRASVVLDLDDSVHCTVVTLVSLQDAQNTHTPSTIYTFTYRHKPGEPDAHRVTLRKRIDTTIPVQHDHPPIYHVKYFVLDANNRWFRQMLYVQ